MTSPEPMCESVEIDEADCTEKGKVNHIGPDSSPHSGKIQLERGQRLHPCAWVAVERVGFAGRFRARVLDLRDLDDARPPPATEALVVAPLRRPSPGPFLAMKTSEIG